MCLSAPIKKFVALLSVFLLLIALICVQPPRAVAQANVGENLVTAATVGRKRSSVTLKTRARKPFPRPIIRFLPGENGDTILVADFPGLIWHKPTKVIPVNSSFSQPLGTSFSAQRRGIRLVRIGRFQESPPVLRIAIISNDLARLRKVSFNSGKGKLTVRWSRTTSRSSAVPPRAPRLVRKHGIPPGARKIPVAPPVTPLDPEVMAESEKNLTPQALALRGPLPMPSAPAGKLETPPETAPAAKRSGGFRSFLSRFKASTKRLLRPKTSTQDQSRAASAPPSHKPAPAPAPQKPSEIAASDTPPVVTVNKAGEGYAVRISSRSGSPLNFKSFRLHGPERFVIDFENLSSLASSGVPTMPGDKLLKGLRVGRPDPEKNTGRLVLDLARPAVSVIPESSGDKGLVSFLVGVAHDPLAGLKPPPATSVVLDAGHGGTDPGAQRGHIREKDITLAVAKKTRDYLKGRGVKVILTRDKDNAVSLADRVAVTNSKRPDVFLSIHVNALESTSDIHGIETYYQTPQSRALANSVHASLVKQLKAPDRSVRKAKFYVVNRTKIPAVLAEIGFISNKSERDKLISSDYQSKVAGALARGVVLYLQKSSTIASGARGSKASSLASRSSAGSPKASIMRGGRGNRVPAAGRLAQKGLGMAIE